MVDFVQNMDVFETALLALFDFGTPSSTQQVVDPLKSIYF